MKKKLDTSSMENELKSGSAFFKRPVETETNPEVQNEASALSSSQDTLESDVNNPVDQSTGPVNQVDRPHQSPIPTQSTKTDNPATEQLLGEVAKRPLAFYIPIAINEKLEEAVLYYQKKHHWKIDRSAVVSAMLGELSLWEPQTLDQLADKVIAQLENRLRNRLSDRLSQSTT